MSWVGVGVAAVGAIKGTMDANANRKQQKKNDAFRKTAIAYSPWTGMGDPGFQSAGNTDGFSGALGGAAQGFALGSGIGGAFKGTAAASAAGGGMGAGGANALGGQDMAKQLGGMGNNVSQMQAQVGGGGMYKSLADNASAGAMGTANSFQMPQMGGGMYAQMQKPKYGLGM